MKDVIRIKKGIRGVAGARYIGNVWKPYVFAYGAVRVDPEFGEYRTEKKAHDAAKKILETLMK
jgi:hypothetical protein